jgi:hypothetical protein
LSPPPFLPANKGRKEREAHTEAPWKVSQRFFPLLYGFFTVFLTGSLHEGRITYLIKNINFEMTEKSGRRPLIIWAADLPHHRTYGSVYGDSIT